MNLSIIIGIIIIVTIIMAIVIVFIIMDIVSTAFIIIVILCIILFVAIVIIASVSRIIEEQPGLQGYSRSSFPCNLRFPKTWCLTWRFPNIRVHFWESSQCKPADQFVTSCQLGQES